MDMSCDLMKLLTSWKNDENNRHLCCYINLLHLLWQGKKKKSSHAQIHFHEIIGEIVKFSNLFNYKNDIMH